MILKKKKQPKYRAMAVGRFENEAHTIWSTDTAAYTSVKEFVKAVGDKDPYYECLAEELHVKPEELPAHLEAHDGIPEMCALIKVLLAVRFNIAIKGFERPRDAVNFLSFLEQIGYAAPADPETEALMTDIPQDHLKKWTKLRHSSLVDWKN